MTYAKKPSTVPPPEEARKTAAPSHVSTVPIYHEETLRNHNGIDDSPSHQPSVVQIPKEGTQNYAVSASTTQPLFYRLSPNELDCPDYEKILLLSIDLRRSQTILSLGHVEEENYRTLSRAIADLSFQQSEDFTTIATSLTHLVENWNQPRNLKKLLNGRLLREALDDYTNRIKKLENHLINNKNKFNEIYTKSLVNKETIQRIVSILYEAHSLFEKKVQQENSHLLHTLQERTSMMESILNDNIMQLTQLDLYRHNTQKEINGCQHLLTSLISQIEQLSAVSPSENLKETSPLLNVLTAVRSFFPSASN